MAGSRRLSSGVSKPAGWWLALVMALAIGTAYWRVQYADFNWDDDMHITANPTIVGPLGLKEIWTSGKANYFPLTMTSFWVQHALWDLKPGPYHVVTVLFHIASAIALWRVLLRLNVPGAWLGATIWALHPVQVESAAWICELKNTQSALFYLLAILFFLRWGQGREQLRWDRTYTAAWLAALFAILSKSSTVMLPVVLALIGWWQGRRQWREAWWLVPFLALSLLASGWTIWEQKVNSMASGPDWGHGLASRLMIAGKVPWFYLGKLLWPEPLVFIYPRWDVNALGFLHWVPLLATVGLGIVLWLKRNTAWRPVFVALTYFFVSLFPVLGLFDVFFFKYSFVGDHLQYLASMGPLVLIGALVATVSKKRATISLVARAGFVAGLGAMTYAQTGIYLTQETLWKDTVALNPNAWIARMNLGTLYLAKREFEKALREFEGAEKARPGDPLTAVNFAVTYLEMQRPTDAVAVLQEALPRMPHIAEGHNTMAVALLRLGRSPEAIPHLETALRVKPDFPGARSNLVQALTATGRSLLERGQPTDAAAYYEKALLLADDNLDVRSGLGVALFQSGRVAEALPHYLTILERQPSAGAHNNVASGYLQLNRTAEAIEHYQRALALEPEFHDARANLALALGRAGRRDEAMAELKETLRRNPNHAGARAILAGLADEASKLPASSSPNPP